MANEQDEFITIRPRQVALSHHHAGATATVRFSPLPWLLGGGLLLLAAMALWVFLYLPDRVQQPVIASASTTSTAPPQAVAPAPAPAHAEPTAAPFEELQIERERKRAQDTLARLIVLQIKLDEQMHVAQWSKDPFDAALKLANQGDDLFTKQKYDEAMASYEQGIAALTQLVDAGETRFNGDLTTAAAALDQRDAAAAAAAFTDAALIYPDDARISAGRARVQLLPQIVELIDDAERAVERNDWRAALAKYRAVRDLDPNTNGVSAALDAAATRVANLDFQGQLSAGYAALEGSDFDTARGAFNKALQARPNDPAARDGLSQVEQRATLTRIDQLQQKALRDEAAEHWAEALASYDEVLKVDRTIKFAKDGEERAKIRLDLEQKLAAVITDPGALSSDTTFAETALLYKNGVKIAHPGPRLTNQLDQMEKILATAAEPVAVTLTSDAATEVTISQLGPLGTFTRKEVRLRPGRYLIMGSRDGRRDLRQELNVTPKMAPVEVSCRETI